MLDDPRPIPWWFGLVFVIGLLAFVALATVMTEAIKRWLDAPAPVVRAASPEYVDDRIMDVEGRLIRIERDVAAVRAVIVGGKP